MTMTTVGYGDIIPCTFMGALIGCVTMFIGVLSVALPISVLSSTFSEKYADYTTDSNKVCNATHSMLR
jgi:voltage-gated potassium channel